MSSFLSSARQHTPQMRKWHLVKQKFRKTEKNCHLRIKTRDGLPKEERESSTTLPQRQRNPRELPHCINEQCMRIPRDSRSTSDKHLENGTALIHLSDALPDKKGLCLRLHGTQGTQEKQDSIRQGEFVAKIDGKIPIPIQVSRTHVSLPCTKKSTDFITLTPGRS